jgi:predicted Zn-dependent protease with MMP-like domain/Tfp pilus assembly protein PilF
MSRTDRLHSLVDKGFSALDEGDPEGAAKLLEQARKIDKTAAAVRLLEAAIADADGEPDRAIAIYDQLAVAHPDDPLPHLHAASTHLYSREDAAAAVAAVDRAIALIEDDDELVDAILVKTRALSAMGEDHLPAARALLRELDSSNIDDPELIATLGETALEVGDTEAATGWWMKLTDDDEWASDAWYGIGLAKDIAGDDAGRTDAWLRVHKLDGAAPRAEFQITAAELERIAAEAVAELPPLAKDRLANVPILIDERPTVAQVTDGVDPRLLGLFEGTPLPEGAAEHTPTLTTIHLFHLNLEASAADAEDLADQIRITVLHETAHFFGLDEAGVAALGLE